MDSNPRDQRGDGPPEGAAEADAAVLLLLASQHTHRRTVGKGRDRRSEEGKEYKDQCHRAKCPETRENQGRGDSARDGKAHEQPVLPRRVGDTRPQRRADEDDERRQPRQQTDLCSAESELLVEQDEEWRQTRQCREVQEVKREPGRFSHDAPCPPGHAIDVQIIFRSRGFSRWRLLPAMTG
jgi:hypothetical protein